ncbi:Tat (twin-arginine translocation) pathway signal sequence domain protein [Plesiocystis pacifica SIR-1]|uniref:Tat (Twin-arginine translocation) pathway signal sequence domain protein n=1 Tax=Plesiocystis pacifica SIR-1 TaxID=391625 RepID=A6GB42_9BACT|nr:DUF1552 domain-containing protein [Plesiocystis pacifica]EDM76924.1 Tat (twin-arginine translocation) pathway signal sequence domain protein [Plesiocystis pacifica SIR-1]
MTALLDLLKRRARHQGHNSRGQTTRRAFLAGLGGVAVGLPFLEALAPRPARANSGDIEPFAIFFRQANGVACAQSTEFGDEPESFWPTALGALTPETVAGRSLDELTGHLSRLLVVRNVNMEAFDFADGHARGALQGLTAQGPVVPGVGGDSEANGESIDHRIGRELNPEGRDSLVLYAGMSGGWLGGPCIAYRGPNNRRAALHDPMLAYQTMMGLDGDQLEELIARQSSVNDMVKDQLDTLMSSPKLSSNDLQRLELHFDSIRELENNLGCNFAEDELAMLAGLSAGYESNIGDEVLAAVRAHMHVAALAVACGYTRSVSIQVGSGNDGSTRYRNLDDDSLMENFHYVSHRRASHDSSGDPIPNADKLHAMVDRQFAQTFNYLVDRLAAYELPNAESLVDCGTCVWYNDNGSGPGHSRRGIPMIIAGSAGGFLRQGECIELHEGDNVANHAAVLNTLGSAAGLRTPSDELISDFGDASLDRQPLTAMMA